MSKRGYIVSCEPRKRFGFIKSEDGYDFFVHQDGIVPDAIGRRLLTVGSEVTFDLEKVKEGWPEQAVHVEHLFAEEVGDPSTHREVSIFTFWGEYRGFLTGFVERESFDSIAVFPEHIWDYERIKHLIAPGLWVSHGVAQKEDDPSLWFATDVVVHLSEEEELEPEVRSISIFTDQEKKMSLKKIIQKRKEAQCS